MPKNNIIKPIFIFIFFMSFVFFPKWPIFLYHENKNLENEFKIQKDSNILDINMLFLGDTMFGRSVESLSKLNINYPFEKIKDNDIFKNKDIIYTNLEGPIMDPNIKTKNGSTIFSFPKYSVDVLKNNNINLVSLSNNHLQDYGLNGYKQTKKFLEESDINFFGDYYNQEHNIFFKKNINGKDFIFFGINMINFDFEKDLTENKKYIIDIIEKTKQENPDTFFIAFPHWGNEYKIKSNSIQQDFAYELIDNGVDLIIGTHPHVTQEYEVYNNKYIFYSLGNFIFDQYFSEETQESIAIKLKTKNQKLKNEYEIEIIPLKSINSQPQVITDKKEKEEFLNKYNLIKNK